MIIRKPFYFVRHGQTDKNLEGVFQGSMDVALNATGIHQAKEARDRLAAIEIASIISSPLSRARTTADIINENFGHTIVENHDLREAEFGAYEGKPHEFWLGEYLAGDDSNSPADIEPLEEFATRTKAAINHALETLPGPVLIVAHGGVYLPINQSLAADQRRGPRNCETIYHEPAADGSRWNVTTV